MCHGCIQMKWICCWNCPMLRAFESCKNKIFLFIKSRGVLDFGLGRGVRPSAWSILGTSSWIWGSKCENFVNEGLVELKILKMRGLGNCREVRRGTSPLGGCTQIWKWRTSAITHSEHRGLSVTRRTKNGGLSVTDQKKLGSLYFFIVKNVGLFWNIKLKRAIFCGKFAKNFDVRAKIGKIWDLWVTNWKQN